MCKNLLKIAYLLDWLLHKTVVSELLLGVSIQRIGHYDIIKIVLSDNLTMRVQSKESKLLIDNIEFQLPITIESMKKSNN